MNFASFSVAAANDSVTWGTVVVALAAGAVGSLLTAVLALSGRLMRIGREIEANNRAIRNIDRHLETWVSDATVDLVRELERSRNHLRAYSGRRLRLVVRQVMRPQARWSMAR